MDSENLRRYETSPSMPASHVRSHKSLQASDKSTSVQKTPRAKQIPWEPVKGAVKPVDKSSSKTETGRAKSTTVQSTINRSSSGGNQTTVESVRKIQIPIYDAPPHLVQSAHSITQRHGKNKLTETAKSQSDGTVSGVAGKSSEFVTINLDNEQKHYSERKGVISRPPPEEREVEGQTRSRSSMEQMLEELTDLKKELEVQTKVVGWPAHCLVSLMFGVHLHSVCQNSICRPCIAHDVTLPIVSDKCRSEETLGCFHG